MTEGRWRHMSCTEMDIYIVDISYLGEDCTKAKVYYLNRHYKSAFMNRTPDHVEIRKEDYWKWSKVYE